MPVPNLDRRPDRIDTFGAPGLIHAQPEARELAARGQGDGAVDRQGHCALHGALLVSMSIIENDDGGMLREEA